MPVRVKPPPADTGETISPGCASFEIATPLNGARMTVSSIAVCCIAIWLSATFTCSCADAMRAIERIDFGFRVVDVVGRVQALLAQLLLALQHHARLCEPHFAFRDLPLRGFELRAIQPERGLQR